MAPNILIQTELDILNRQREDCRKKAESIASDLEGCLSRLSALATNMENDYKGIGSELVAARLREEIASVQKYVGQIRNE